MITEEEALVHILKSVKSLRPRRVPLAQARDRFAAQDIFARLALPVFDNSAMDGYAVVAGSCRAGQSQCVIGEQPAGVDQKLRIAPGEAIRIFTGAPMPEGADAVVMQEDVRRDGSEILVDAEVEPGEFVRRRGSDLSEGQKILSAGERIQPQTLALLAAQGFVDIEVGGEVRAGSGEAGADLRGRANRLVARLRQARQAVSLRPRRPVRDLWIAGQSGLGVCHFSPVCAARDPSPDGRE